MNANKKQVVKAIELLSPRVSAFRRADLGCGQAHFGNFILMSQEFSDISGKRAWTDNNSKYFKEEFGIIVVVFFNDFIQSKLKKSNLLLLFEDQFCWSFYIIV